MSKSQAVDVSVNSGYEVLLSPTFIDVESANGQATSPTVRSTVINGVGPFTYLWTISNEQIFITAPTNPDTAFTTGGYNIQHNGTATLTVTDTGNGNAETSRQVSVKFTFSTF